MNGLSIFQIKVSNKYTGEDFDEDLRTVLRRAGCKGEKICFIMDESNVLDSGFLERMNTLLANGEVPGLFEGDEYGALMTACKEGAQRQGLLLDSHEELYKWFTQQIVRNLHVVFTMNPPQEGLSSKAATSPSKTPLDLSAVTTPSTPASPLHRDGHLPPLTHPVRSSIQRR